MNHHTLSLGVRMRFFLLSSALYPLVNFPHQLGKHQKDLSLPKVFWENPSCSILKYALIKTVYH
jgi:hypothetical protein